MARVKNKRSLFSRILFGFVAVVLSILLVLSYLAVIVNPSKVWWLSLVGPAYLPLLGLSLLWFILGIFRSSRTTLLVGLALLPSLLFAGRYCKFKAPEEAPSDLSIVSYNVGRFSQADGSPERLQAAEEVARMLDGLDADVVCLQEFYLPSGVDIDMYLRQIFKGYKTEYYIDTGSKGVSGNVTASRFPIKGKGHLDFAKSANHAIWTDIDMGGTTVRVYNCHFESYNISLPGIFRSATHGDEQEMEKTEKKMRTAITRRASQVDSVRVSCDRAPVRSVIAGDFNDTPLSYTYQQLIRGRKDSFSAAGKGFGATYRGTGPLLRIDYLLVPEDLETVSYETVRVPYSDHFPIRATYRVKKSI